MERTLETLSFACPHCGAINPIPAAKAVGVVACASCARPFRVEVPAGQLVAGVPAAAATAAGGQVEAKGGSAAILRLHPAIWRMRFAATCCDGVLVTGGLLISFWALWRCEPGAWQWFFLAGAAALWLTGAFNLFLPWLKARGEMLEVTPSATRWSTGILNRRSVEIRHDAVRAVEVKQTLLGRLLGIGTLTLASDGADQDEIEMQGVPGVKEVAAVIRGRMGR